MDPLIVIYKFRNQIHVGKGEYVDIVLVPALGVEPIVAVKYRLGLVEVVAYVDELRRSDIVLVGSVDIHRKRLDRRAELVHLVVVGIQLEDISARYVGIGRHLRIWRHLVYGQTVLVDSYLLAEVVAPAVLAVEEQLHEDSVRRPRQSAALTQIEGHVITQQRAVDVVCQQHPPFVFGHAEHLGAFVELYLVRLLGITPR